MQSRCCTSWHLRKDERPASSFTTGACCSDMVLFSYFVVMLKITSRALVRDILQPHKIYVMIHHMIYFITHTTGWTSRRAGRRVGGSQSRCINSRHCDPSSSLHVKECAQKRVFLPHPPSSLPAAPPPSPRALYKGRRFSSLAPLTSTTGSTTQC